MTEEEFDEFYAESVNRLVGQLYGMTGDLAEAQDVVQDAFVRAWDRRSQLSAAENPEAWVRTVAWRIAVSRWRRVRHAARLHRQHAPENVPAPDETTVLLVDALRQLPEAQRRAIVLHHLADLTVEQVAEETGVPTGTVKARLARGRAALATLLTDPATAKAFGG